MEKQLMIQEISANYGWSILETAQILTFIAREHRESFHDAEAFHAAFNEKGATWEMDELVDYLTEGNPELKETATLDQLLNEFKPQCFLKLAHGKLMSWNY